MLASSISVLRGAAFASLLVGGVWFPVAGFNITVERVLAILGLALLPIAMVRATAAMWALMAWYGVMLFALMASPYAGRLLGGLFVSLVPLGVLALYQPAFGAVHPPRRVILALGLVVGLACPPIFALSSLAPELVAPLMDTGRLSFFAIEANLFGAAAACIGLMLLPYCHSLGMRLLLGLVLVALVLSFSRGPYIGFCIGMLVYGLAMGWHRRPRILVSGIALMLSSAALALAFWDPTVLPETFGRAHTVSVRLRVLQEAWRNIEESFLIGRGPLEFGVSRPGLQYVFGATMKQTVWIWQMFVAIIHDTGFIGLGVYVIFLGLTLTTGVRKLGQDGFRAERASYLAAFVALLIISQTTTAHMTGLFGALAGIVVAPLAIRRRPSP